MAAFVTAIINQTNRQLFKANSRKEVVVTFVFLASVLFTITTLIFF